MKHLIKEQRYTISKLKAKNVTNIYIADLLGVYKSTIGQELKRNANKLFSESIPPQSESPNQKSPNP